MKTYKISFVVLVLIILAGGQVAARQALLISDSTGNGITPDSLSILKADFLKLDSTIRKWWDEDIHTANEQDICADKRNLLYLPFPYSTAGGSEKSFPEMYGWDTFFINLAMLQYGRTDLVKNHILNHLFMIEKYGYVLNANRLSLSSRSQPPLLAESVINYFRISKDTSLLMMAFPLLEKEYNSYWNAPHHLTPVGLSTCRDSIDPSLRMELASEAESGLDFTACYNGNITECVPLHINCILVKYEKALAEIAAIFNLRDKSDFYLRRAASRTANIIKYCWNQQDGFFYEYNFVKKEQIKIPTLCAYWTIWAGVTSEEQTRMLVKNLKWFEQPGGLSFASENFPSPHKEFAWLQWGFPSGWPPMFIITDIALRQSGHSEEADRISYRYMGMVLNLYNSTGKLWEKYNVADRSISLPSERKGYVNNPMHGWSSAAVVILGKNLFLYTKYQGNNR